MRLWCASVLIALAAIIAATGCAGGGSSDPVLPPSSSAGPGGLSQAVNAVQPNHWLWGYYLVSIDRETLSAEVMPIRAAAGHWNVLQFLENGPCADCFKLAEIAQNPDGTLNVYVSIKHPFANPNLTGFDVRGIAMFDGGYAFPESGLVMSDPGLNQGELLNADGYTSLYNPTTLGQGFEGYVEGKLATVQTPTATLNAFKRYVTGDPSNTRNAFFAGDEVTVNNKIDMPDPFNPWVFGYAVDACWAPPINKPVDDPITDFGLAANCPEAWKISVTSTFAGDGLHAGGGTATLRIDVYDRQGTDDAHPVLVECPELFDGAIEGTWESDGDGYARYEAEIGNVKLASCGFHPCLVSKQAQENDPVAKPWLDLTAYQVFDVNVGWHPGYPIDVTPPWLNLRPLDICVEGNYAYIAAGINGLLIFDVSDPVNPVWVNWVDTDWTAVRVAVSGSYALVATSSYVAPYHWRLLVIDIDPPESAHIVNTVQTGWAGYVCDLAVSGGSACLTTRVQSGPDLFVVDIDPPESADIVFWTPLPFSSDADVAAADGYAYVLSGWGIEIYDIDPPESTHGVRTLDSAHDEGIAVSGGYAYVADWHFGLQIIDVDPPESAYIVNSVDTPYNARDVVVSGGYAFVTSENNQIDLHIVDVDPPESAYLVNSVNVGYEISAIAAAGGYVYVAYGCGGIRIIDVDPPESAYSVNLIDTLSSARGVAVWEGCAYVADDYGLRIIDIDPPESAYIAKSIDTPGSANGVAVSAGYAYVADGESGLQIIGINPPESAYIVNTVDTPGDAQGVAIQGEWAYVADGESGLQIIDISPPASAYIVNAVDTPGSANEVAVSGGYAYVADDGSGLQIVDIDPPELAYIVDSVSVANTALGVAVWGDYAYVADGNAGLRVIDVGVPESAHEVKRIDTPGYAYDVAVSGHYAYVADDSGLQIIDVGAPGSAYIVQSVDTPSYAWGVAVSGDYVYVAGYTFGLRIVKLW